MTQQPDSQAKPQSFFRNLFPVPTTPRYDFPVFEEIVPKEEVPAKMDREPLPPDVVELSAPLAMAIPRMSREELEDTCKRYYAALRYLSEVECREGDVWCYEDDSVECEHNYARKALSEGLGIP